MKRIFPTSLALLLVTGSLGNVFAAAFCTRVAGRACCLAMTPSNRHAPSSGHEAMSMPGMPMDSAAMDGMVSDDISMDEDSMPMDDMSETSAPITDDDALASKFEQPLETCTHCLSHSGILNAPLSSVSAADESRRDLGSVPCPVSRFLVRSAIIISQSGLPREHAPPVSTPRHILISVFLI